jgi:hypothetical protein
MPARPCLTIEFASLNQRGAIGGQRAAIPIRPSMRQGNFSQTHHPRVIETLRRSQDHTLKKREKVNLVNGLQRSAVGAPMERTTRSKMLIHLPRKEVCGLILRTKKALALAGYGPGQLRDCVWGMSSGGPGKSFSL